MDDLVLRFGDPSGNRIEFVLAEGDENNVDGPIRCFLGDHVFVLSDRSGIEARALSLLRDDLRLLDQRGGYGYFVDHDFSVGIRISGTPDDLRVLADVPSFEPDGLWEVPLGRLETSDLDRLIAVVDAADARFGPLIGYCGGCGIPQPTWQPLGPA